MEFEWIAYGGGLPIKNNYANYASCMIVNKINEIFNQWISLYFWFKNWGG